MAIARLPELAVWISGRLGSHEGPNVSARAMDRARRARAGMPRFSSPVRTFLQRGQLEFAEKLDDPPPIARRDVPADAS